MWHFLSIRFVECKGAPRQGEYGGFQHVAEGGLEARQLVVTMGKVFDLRRLAVEPCTLEDREEALEAICALAVTNGIDLQVRRAPWPAPNVAAHPKLHCPAASAAPEPALLLRQRSS